MYKRFRCCVLGLVLVSLCLSVTAAPALAQLMRMVTGVVTDEDGNPIPGALVTAENPGVQNEGFEDTTDDSGRYRMMGLRSGGGGWTISARAEGYQPDQVITPTRIGQNLINFRLNRIPTALELALGKEALAGLDPEVVEKEIDAANDFFSTQQYGQAIAAYEALVAKLPALAFLHIQIGHSYSAQEEHDKAITAYEEALKHDPESAAAKIGVGRANLAAGNMEAAEAALGDTASSLEAGREDFYNMGELAFVQNDIEEAAGWYEKAHMKDPTWGKPLFKLALVALNKGDTETAATYFQQVVDVDPNSEEGAQARVILQQLQP